MATLMKYGSVKRYGARYGRRVKEKAGKIEEERKTSNTCPYCRKEKLRRIAAGIWSCSKCNMKTAGGAYIAHRKATEASQSGQ